MQFPRMIQRNNVKAGWALFKRELIISKQKSFLVVFWDILEPLIMAVFFVLLYQKKVFEVPHTGMSYGLYVAFGMLLWQSFFEALNQPIMIFDKYKNLFAHVKINNGVILYSMIFNLVYNLAFRAVIMLAILIYYEKFVLLYSLYFVIGILFIIIPGISIGFFLAVFEPIKEDIKRVVNLISRPLMFLSCTIFPMPDDGILLYVDFLNPAAVFINNIRFLAVNGSFYNFSVFIIWVIFFILFFLFSWKFFKFTVKYSIDRA